MNRRRRALVFLLAAVIGATALETFARIRMRVKYGRFDSDFYANHVDAASGLRLPDPSQDVGFVHINAHGLRGPEIVEPRRPGTVRIAFVGGSTTFCAEVDQESMWPVQVCRRLAAREPGLQFEPIVAALPGQFVEQARKLVDLEVAPLRPDVFVIYEATNDLSRDTRQLADAQGLFVAVGDERSWLARTSVAWDLIEKNFRAQARARAASTGEGRLKFDAEDLARRFESSLTRLVDRCRELSPCTMLCTFCTRLRAEQSEADRLAAASSSLYYMPYMDVPGLLDGFAAYNRAIRRVGATTATTIAEIEGKIPGDARHFHDSVHFTKDGCDVMADLVVNALVADATFLATLKRARESTNDGSH